MGIRFSRIQDLWHCIVGICCSEMASYVPSLDFSGQFTLNPLPKYTLFLLCRLISYV